MNLPCLWNIRNWEVKITEKLHKFDVSCHGNMMWHLCCGMCQREIIWTVLPLLQKKEMNMPIKSESTLRKELCCRCSRGLVVLVSGPPLVLWFFCLGRGGPAYVTKGLQWHRQVNWTYPVLPCAHRPAFVPFVHQLQPQKNLKLCAQR